MTDPNYEEKEMIFDILKDELRDYVSEDELPDDVLWDIAEDFVCPIK